MSERGKLEVLVPVSRWPETRREQREVSALALAEARRLAGSVGGRLLGVSKRARAVHPVTGEGAVKVTFVVEAPESTWEQPRVHPVS